MLGGGDGDLFEFVGRGDGGVEEAEFEGALEGGLEAAELVVDLGVLDEVEDVGCTEVAGDRQFAEGEADAGEVVEEGVGLVAWGLGREVGGVGRGGVVGGDAGVAARGVRGEDRGQWTVERGHGKWQIK